MESTNRAGIVDARASRARRVEFDQAARAFTDLAGRASTSDLALPALGVWTVRDLLGHASRALSTIEAYVPSTAVSTGPPPGGFDLTSPADYYVSARAVLAGPAAVTERGRAAGRALGADPAGAVRELADRVLALVAATPDDSPVGSPVGTMPFIQYLPTRTFELTVHCLDLARVLPDHHGATPVPALGPAIASGLGLAAELAAAGPHPADLLLLLTGRTGLRPGLSAL
ncbi:MULTISPECIES: maleylpyruvate isomerase N-terminal domain-containing protein [unclassified Parafrankia]|uniref:maleylpyruvate isomerase N-terminal domain-containing protein n=1 Tax=unclassified Parafrankia TaxID=2994368 RepID=UPI000DA52742|nr:MULTISPECIES: maleylpyruvate isomerase N-terminal domain-containing protein [unclassified Parafrankia]SQD98546.1 conserved hypothetical protein [Parafrankia sp. Ea1.12]